MRSYHIFAEPLGLPTIEIQPHHMLLEVSEREARNSAQTSCQLTRNSLYRSGPFPSYTALPQPQSFNLKHLLPLGFMMTKKFYSNWWSAHLHMISGLSGAMATQLSLCSCNGAMALGRTSRRLSIASILCLRNLRYSRVCGRYSGRILSIRSYSCGLCASANRG